VKLSTFESGKNQYREVFAAPTLLSNPFPPHCRLVKEGRGGERESELVIEGERDIVRHRETH
jgi:hypothetical protein